MFFSESLRHIGNITYYIANNEHSLDNNTFVGLGVVAAGLIGSGAYFLNRACRYKEEERRDALLTELLVQRNAENPCIIGARDVIRCVRW